MENLFHSWNLLFINKEYRTRRIKKFYDFYCYKSAITKYFIQFSETRREKLFVIVNLKYRGFSRLQEVEVIYHSSFSSDMFPCVFLSFRDSKDGCIVAYATARVKKFRCMQGEKNANDENVRRWTFRENRGNSIPWSFRDADATGNLK